MKIKFEQAVLLLLAGVLFAGCSRNEMNLPAGYKVTVSVGGVSFAMAYVPGGTFPTGIGTQTTAGSGAVDATVNTPYYLAETEVTYELWYKVRTWAIANGYTFTNPGNEGNDGIPGALPTASKNEPVTFINWREAMVWCNALTEFYNANYGSDAALDPVYYTADHVTPIRYADDNPSITYTIDGSQDMPYVKPGAKGFRLPGSMEWECAARYKDGINWTAGNYASGGTGECTGIAVTDYPNFNPFAWYSDNTTSTQPVAGKTANALDLYDMSGNVWEWCFDWHPSFIGINRVHRSGSWSAPTCHNQRVGLEAGNGTDLFLGAVNIGFRFVRSAP